MDTYGRISQFVLKLTILSVILLPAIPTPFLRVRLDDVVPTIWFLVSFSVFMNHGLSGVSWFRIAMLFGLATLLPLSIFNGIVAGYDGSFGDLNQWSRLLKYLAIYSTAIVYFESGGSRVGLLRFTVKCGLVALLIAVSQYFDPLHINERYVPFISPTHFDTLVGGYPTPRPVGMMTGPNDLALLFAVLSIIAIFMAAQTGKYQKYYTAAFLFAGGIFLTLSRGGMAALAAAILTLAAWNLRWLRFKHILVLCALLAGIVWLLMYEPVYDLLTWRFVRLFDTYEPDASLAQRIENWQANLEIAAQHYILGVGPLRYAGIELAADNEWLLMLRSYGIIGVMIVSLLIAAPMLSLEGRRGYGLALSAMIFVFMAPAAVFFDQRNFALILIFMAALDSWPQSERRHSQQVARAAYRSSPQH